MDRMVAGKSSAKLVLSRIDTDPVASCSAPRGFYPSPAIFALPWEVSW